MNTLFYTRAQMLIVLGICLAVCVVHLMPTNVHASADYSSEPVFNGQWDVLHESAQTPLLEIDTKDDDEVHVLNYHDQEIYAFEEDGEQEDAWEDFDCVSMSDVRNIAIDKEENVFVLETGETDMLRRFSEDYFEDYCEEDDYEAGSGDLPDVITWQLEAGKTDLSANTQAVYVLSAEKLLRIELTSGEVREIAISGGMAVAVNQSDHPVVLTNGGNTVMTLDSELAEKSVIALSTTSHDVSVDYKGNIYLAQDSGQVTQHDESYAQTNLIQLPSGVIPAKVTVSNDGEVFIVAKDTSTIYNYKFRDIPEPKQSHNAVYRFWSSAYKGHFYTASFEEAKYVADNDANWEYERIAYNHIDEDEPDTARVYRFWSDLYKHHFYTSSEQEKDHLIANDPNWSYEGEVYSVYSQQQPDTVPTYRFWSEAFKGHFYTTSEGEKNYLETSDSNWAYEGIAWWAIEEDDE